MDQDAANGETIAHSFGHGDDIRLYLMVLESEKFTAPAKTGLYLIGNKYGSVALQALAIL